jgi:hypothetical protein
MGVGGQRHVPVALPPGKTASAHFTGGYLSLGGGLDNRCLYDPLHESMISVFHIT